MKRIELASGYTVSNIIKGCWQLSNSHGRSMSAREAIDDLHTFVTAGITTFDCADIYTGVEELLGLFRKECPNISHLVQIHTKFVPDLNELPRMHRGYVERIIDRSLIRLHTERLDLVQFHWWDWEIPGYLETAGHLAELQKAGKIRHLGVTNFDVLHIEDLLAAGIKIVSNQVQYSLLDTRPEHGMTALCRKYRIQLLCYGALAGGFLSRAWMNQTEPQEDKLENRSLVKYKLIIDELGGWQAFQKLLRVLDRIAIKNNVDIAPIAMQFVLQKPEVAGIIVGAHSRHIDDVVKGGNLTLDDDDMREIQIVISESRPIPGDVYSLERIKESKHARIMRRNLNNSP